MSSDPNTITSTLSRMEKSELISRQPHELDRRAHRVRLLPAGRRAFGQGKKIAVALQEHVLTALPPGRRTKFLEELALVAEACGAVAERPFKKSKSARANAEARE
jgi:DNA-binding MarR family transcriptional regulator